MAATKEVEEVKATPFVNAKRTVEFWRRASGVYAAYKGAQVSYYMQETFIFYDRVLGCQLGTSFASSCRQRLPR